MFVLVVSLRVKPDKDPRFLAAIETNAAASLREEPGCLRFDVLRDNADPHHYLLYEMYADEAALQAHRATPHFAAWRQAAADCVDERTNTPRRCCSRVTRRRARPPSPEASVSGLR